MTGPDGAAPSAGRRRVLALRLVSLAIFLAVLATFLPATRNGFVDWDDHVAIVGNPEIRGLGWQNIRWMFSSFLLGPYQPLAWLSLAIDYRLWGLDPRGFHLTSAIVHAANAALFFLVAAHLLAARSARLAGAGPSVVLLGAATAAIVFGLHPLRVESVAWATERRDVLSGFFVMLTFLAYVRGRAADGIEMAARASGGTREAVARGGSGTVAAFYLLALLCKASVVTVPLVLLLLDIFPLRRLPPSPRRWGEPGARAVLAEKVPLLLAAVLFSAVAWRGQILAKGARTLAEAGVADRLAAASYGAALYIAKTVVPSGLSPLYEFPRSPEVVHRLLAVGCLCVAGATALAVCWRGRAPAVLAAWVSYLVLLAPVSGLVRVGLQLAADRYTYLACLPWALLAGAGVARLGAVRAGGSRGTAGVGRVPRRFAVAGVLLLAGLGVSLAALSQRQIGVWRDTLSLWRRVTETDRASAVGHFGLGGALAKAGSVEEAIRAYREAVRLDPGFADARNSLATLLAESGRLEEARAEFLAIEAQYPSSPLVNYQIGLVEDRLGRPDAAIERYRKAIGLQPRMSSARANLALMLAERDAREEALALLAEGIALSPADSTLLRAHDHILNAP